MLEELEKVGFITLPGEVTNVMISAQEAAKDCHFNFGKYNSFNVATYPDPPANTSGQTASQGATTGR